MIEQNNDWLTKVSDRMGAKVGELYTTWHSMYSTETSYRWLEENNYTIEVILESKHQNDLSIYLVEQFVKWYREALLED